MRGLDFLLGHPQVDPERVLVSGLSMGGEITTYTAALDIRLKAAISAGFSPDMDVVFFHGNHPCWMWVYANIREYIDASDLHALIAPRPLVVLTGKQDFTYSNMHPPFAGDKQVLRRSRIAYGAEVNKVVHYLHYDAHRYHVGDINPVDNTQLYVRIPQIIAPLKTGDTSWQVSNITILLDNENLTLFDYITQGIFNVSL